MFGTLSTREKAWVIAVLTCLALLSVDALATERPALPAKPPGSEQAPDSVAFYHFMLGYQRELNNAAGEAEAEYLKALARDPNSVASASTDRSARQASTAITHAFFLVLSVTNISPSRSPPSTAD